MKAEIINNSTVIKNLNYTISCQAKNLKDEIKKNKLLMQFIQNPRQEEILKVMLDHIKNCPQCELKFIEKINSCAACIYFDSCKDEEKKPGCKKRLESVV